MTTSLTFIGGAGSVTGSKYLIDTGSAKLLVDCGMFQGTKALRQLNWQPFPVDPSTIDAVAITHAHLDHTGYLPRLVRLGFRGPILATAATRQLAELVLRDSAQLQEQDALDAARGGYSKHAAPEPLYTLKDVAATMERFRGVDFDADIAVLPGVVARWYRAGHILGSASIRLQTADAEAVFSGDLGRGDHPVLRGRETPAGARTVLIESTYGDRLHPGMDDDAHETLAAAIRAAAGRGGSVLIPVFAVDRTEVVLKTLAEMTANHRIPDLPIYLDSPMGLKALAIYQSAAARDELRPDLADTDLAAVPNLHEVVTTEQSIQLNRPGRPCVILSSSGMATGGRVVHHLQHLLPDPNNAVVFTGYQAIGTRGANLVAGAKHIKMYGQYVPVRADIALDDGFSAHADQADLLAWLKALDPAPQTVYCVHGETGSAALADKIMADLGCAAVVPTMAEKVLLSD